MSVLFPGSTGGERPEGRAPWTQAGDPTDGERNESGADSPSERSATDPAPWTQAGDPSDGEHNESGPDSSGGGGLLGLPGRVAGDLYDAGADTVADTVIDHPGDPDHDSVDLPGPSVQEAAATAGNEAGETVGRAAQGAFEGAADETGTGGRAVLAILAIVAVGMAIQGATP